MKKEAKKPGKMGMWVLSVFLLLMAFSIFPSFSSVFLIMVSLFVIPLSKVQKFRRNIIPKKSLRVFLGVILFLIGCWVYPTKNYDAVQTVETTEQELLEVDTNVGKESNGFGAEEDEEFVEKVETLPVSPVESEEEEVAISVEGEEITEVEALEEQLPEEVVAEEADSTTEEITEEVNVPVEETVQATTYTLNTNTMKFHVPSCSSAKKIKDSNKASFTGSREELIAKGYEACKNCHP